jgi:hypothetical protein
MHTPLINQSKVKAQRWRFMPTACSKREGGESTMSIFVTLPAIAALIAGILILVMPKLLNYIVAVYLIVIGIIGMTH